MKNKTNDILRRAFMEADVEYFEQLTKQTDIEWIPSEGFERKMEALIHKLGRYADRPRMTAWKKAACAVVIFAVLAFSTWNIEAIREPVVDFFTEIYEKFSSLFTVKDEDMNYPEAIETEYLPTAVPTEYKVELQNKNPTFNQTVYSNKENIKIIFVQQTLSESHSMLDTEGTEIYNVSVGAQSGQYFINKGVISLYWTAHDYLFFLSIPDTYSIEDAVRIAESLERVEQ